MRLHENKELFQDAIIATSQQKNIPEIFIEKDYWVTFALYQIFKNDTGLETIFKGGTALQKCFGLIDRFSEDIDLVVLRNENETGNQLKNKIKNISKCVSKLLPEVNIQGITNKKGKIRKTAHAYERVFKGNFGQVRDIIIIESTWLGNFEPYSKSKINTFIYEMMLMSKQQNLIDEYILNPFEVFVLNPERTLCEKIMSLVRFSQSNNPIPNLKNKIRHLYDIHLLLKNDAIKKFFDSNEFDKMILQVANDDIESFKTDNQWLAIHPKSALIFSNTTTTWNEIKTVYTNNFSELIFGKLPKEQDILKDLTSVSERLKKVKWTINL